MQSFASPSASLKSFARATLNTGPNSSVRNKLLSGRTSVKIVGAT